MLTYYIATLALVPFFATRALIPVFATALLARVGGDWGWLAQWAGIQLVEGLPAWMTSDPSLVILGLAALAELLLTKSADFRRLVQIGEPGLKGLTCFFLCFQLVDGDFTELFEILRAEGPAASQAWFQSFGYSWSLLIGWAAYWTCTLRGAVFGTVAEIDEDDDLGVQSVISWGDDATGFFGVFLVFLFPVLALIFSGLAVVTYYLIRAYLRRREEKQKLPCTGCQTPNHRCAVICPGCGSERETVMGVGVLGIIGKETVTDHIDHRRNMIARKRCHACGERLHEKSVTHACRVCGAAPFQSKADLEAYLSRVSETMPKTLLISTLLSAIPLLGLIPGIIYYRINLISSLRCYVPKTTGCLTKWAVRLMNLILICLQPIPFLGMLTIPLMVWTNFLVYRGTLRAERRRLPEGAPSPVFA